jgi:hypothetical protein
MARHCAAQRQRDQPNNLLGSLPTAGPSELKEQGLGSRTQCEESIHTCLVWDLTRK